ncbi:riboflavin synthase [Alcaligenaceae bacterium]|nr:riboflavin synthase [Alcaligenaceae bacterium]
MFTGIVTAVGRITEVSPLAQGGPDAGVRLTIHAPGFLRESTRLGDSIAIQGACMTVVAMRADEFQVDVSRESLDRTAGLSQTGEVNLEHAMRLGDSLDGHIVSGHVDGTGLVTVFAPVGESWSLRILVSTALGRYMAYKGSVTVNGVSLTVNSVEDREDGCEIGINLIPHTVQVTTLKALGEGAKVNIEIDMIARYCERLLGARAEGGGGT